MRDLSNNNLGTSSRRDFVKGSLGLAVVSSAAFATPSAEAAPQLRQFGRRQEKDL
jgi:hypothetical protein